MKVFVENLGALDQAEFELAKFTIVCGKNNTGKTYATYALFGFLKSWRKLLSIRIKEEHIRRLLHEGAIELDIAPFVANAQETLRKGCEAFTEQLPGVFASSPRHFSDSNFSIRLDPGEIRPGDTYDMTVRAAKAQLFSISKKNSSKTVSVSLLVDKEKVKLPQAVISDVIGDALKDIVFDGLFPNPFIASAERTGAAIFRKELHFARNRLLEQMSSLEKDLDPLDLLTKVYSDYALPVKTNVDFTRQLEQLAKNDSFIAQRHPDLLRDFSDIIGGAYHVSKNDELYFVPQGKRIKLTMDESSSAVRSLLDIGFYLRHVARPGDLLMVDEPELNLHPENQRRVARLFSRLVNLGVKVFITTHSDYIVKELNTLIMLNDARPRIKEIMARERYKHDELLSTDDVKVYVAGEKLMRREGMKRSTRCMTFEPADVDPRLGIEVGSFDTTIDDMNRIQEAILFSGEDA